MKNRFLPVLLISILMTPACSNRMQKTGSSQDQQQAAAISGPDAIIYKTKADYQNLVPVILNEDKSAIVSFPAPGDLKYKGQPSTPTTLENGFLLDNRGINAHVAFLSISYTDYMALEKTPAAGELMEMIIDKDPLTEMYSCGKRQAFNDEVAELNARILANDLSGFKKLK